MHYHNCEISHYVLYSNRIMNNAEGDKYFIKPGDSIYCTVDPEGLTILKILLIAWGDAYDISFELEKFFNNIAAKPELSERSK